jgi:hypothetical protein
MRLLRCHSRFSWDIPISSRRITALRFSRDILTAREECGGPCPLQARRLTRLSINRAFCDSETHPNAPLPRPS